MVFGSPGVNDQSCVYGLKGESEQAVAVQRTTCIRACFYLRDDLDQSACSSVSSTVCEGAFIITTPVKHVRREDIYRDLVNTPET